MMITTVNTFGEWLAAELNKLEWSQRELARRAEISSSMISEVISGNKKPGWDFCAALSRPLQRTPLELFQLAGLLPPKSNLAELRAEYYARSLTPNEGELLELYRQLNDMGQEAVTVLARGLVDRQNQHKG